jgi:hypothetical protein
MPGSRFSNAARDQPVETSADRYRHTKVGDEARRADLLPVNKDGTIKPAQDARC